MAARHARSLAQALGVSQSVRFRGFQQPSRGFAAGGGGDHELKVNFWEAPLSPSKWHSHHLVLIVLAGWGCIFTGGYKTISSRKKETKPENVGQASI